MRIQIEYDVAGEEILDFIMGFPQATFFHTPAWMEILVSSFPAFSGAWLTARKGTVLEGIMPFVRVDRGLFFSLWAMPFGTYGTPVSGEQEVIRALTDKFASIANSPRCLEAAAALFDLDLEQGRFTSMGPGVGECSLIHLNGDFEEYRSKGLSSKKRQICNGCEKEGVEVRLLGDERELSLFYEIYLSGSTGWGGVHPYPRRFFDQLFRRRNDGVMIWGAFFEEKLLGGHIDMYFGRMAQAWQAGMSDRSHKMGIASFLVYKAVEEAIDRKIKIFNLGSSGSDGGMMFFKKSMGGEAYFYPVLEIRKKWWKWLRRR